MKKVIVVVLAVVMLVACLAVARWADRNTKVPNTKPSTNNTVPSSTQEPTQPTSSTAPSVPADIENGLGWG